MRKFLSLLLALLMLPLPGALAAENYETLPEHMQMTQTFEHERQPDFSSREPTQ